MTLEKGYFPEPRGKDKLGERKGVWIQRTFVAWRQAGNMRGDLCLP